MTTTCKREGCDKPVKSRQLCQNHYQEFRRAMGGKLNVECSPEIVLSVLPATRAQIMEKTKLSEGGVDKAIRILKDRKAIHVADYAPLTHEHGVKRQRIFAAGPGPDAEVPKEERIASELARYRRNIKRQRDKKRAEAGLPPKAPKFASLLAPLLNQ
jgi:hypothetical protein